MIITICPRCGSMNVTTTCTKCGWSQLTKSTISTRITGEIEIMLSGKALLDDYKRLLLENRNLKEYIAELEAEKDILEDQQREAKNILIDKKLHVDSLYEDGFKLQKRIAELESAQRWIPVSERLPEDRATVLVAFTEYPEQIDILTATYYKRYEGFGGVDNWWDIEGWHSGNVTHWMPLPESPKERER